MRIFISGIAGFLGSHLAERLLAMGHTVVGCDSLLGGELINVPPEAEFYQYDCRDFNAMAKVMRGCELVYHCAATAYEGLSVFAPAMIMDNIVTGSVVGVLRRHRRRCAAHRVLLLDGALRNQCGAVPGILRRRGRRTPTVSPR